MTILGNPAHQPYTPIILQHLTGNPGNVPANQLWGRRLRARLLIEPAVAPPRLGRRHCPEGPTPSRKASSISTTNTRPNEGDSCLSRSRTRRARQRSGRSRSPVAEAELDALRARIAATRWPNRELVADRSQGVQLATIQELARYWTTDYDWRKCEAKLNALPQFKTEIDGVDIHFIHVKSPH